MKKKISLLLCTLFMILSLAGCSDNSETTYDSAEAENLAEFLITNFSQMGIEDMNEFKALSEYQLNYTLMTSGLPIDADVFVSMLDSWMAAEVECGEYISHGDYEVEVKSSGVVVSTLAEYEDREATISFSFGEDDRISSLDVSAKFAIGEILTKAGLNTLLGMGTVFAVLIFLAFVISLMKYIPAILDKLAKKEKTPVEASAPVEAAPVVVEDEADDLELIAVITAAIAAQEGTSTDGFVVRSIKRRPSNKWN